MCMEMEYLCHKLEGDSAIGDFSLCTVPSSSARYAHADLFPSENAWRGLLGDFSLCTVPSSSARCAHADLFPSENAWRGLLGKLVKKKKVSDSDGTMVLKSTPCS
jgi:hypothetical protein